MMDILSIFFYANFTSSLIERRFVGGVLLSRLRDSVSSSYEEINNVWKKIDEVSKLSGVSKRTLQYYDDEGILPVKRSKNNYRLYDDDTMEKLWEILWYKEMGFDLKEIKVILEEGKDSVIEEKINKINNTIRVLEEQKKVIEYIQRYSIPVKSEENNQTYKDQIKLIRKENGM